MAVSKIKTASVLAFEKKLANSDAVMYAGKWEGRDKSKEWEPILLQEKAVRGTISNRLKNAIQSDPLKLDAEIQKANLQIVDTASLPIDCDTLKVSFTLRVLSDVGTPSVCNFQEYQQALENKIDSYIKKYDFSELSIRYAYNIANGRFLWRNRIGAKKIEIKVSVDEGASYTFNAIDFGLIGFDHESKDLTELSKIIKNGLTGKHYVCFLIEAYVLIGHGQEVFPSQELVLDDNKNKNKKSKILYHLNNIAAMHSQKIGNALRTIDTWYSDAIEAGPIAVEPYGSVTSRGKAYRQPKEKIDFFTLLDKWVNKNEDILENQKHYVIATLIRGGVFGETSKDDKKSEEGA